MAIVRGLTEENAALCQVVQNLKALVKQSVETMGSSLKVSASGLTEDMTILVDMVWKDKETMNANLTLL